MAEPTLQQIFGANATQTANLLTISKADLATVGLTASANNTAESLYVGILLLAASYLTDTNLAANPEQQIAISERIQSLVTRNNQTYRQRDYSVRLQKLDTSSAVDPDDY